MGLNLTTVSNLIKRFSLVLALVFVAIILIFFIAYRFYQNQKPPQIEAPSFNEYPTKISRLETKNLPSPKDVFNQLPVFRIQKSNLLVNSATLASKLGFSNESKEINDVNLGKGLVYSKNDATLIVYSEAVSYQKLTQSSINPNADQEKLKVGARGFLLSLGLDSNLPEISQAIFTQVPSKYPSRPGGLERLGFVKISLPYTIEGVGGFVIGDAVNVTFDHQDEVLGFNYRQLKTSEKLKLYPLISFGEAVDIVREGGGKLIKVEAEIIDTRLLKNIENVSLDKAYIAYYLPAKTPEIIQPVWIFEGKGQLKETQAGVIFAVPAIKSKYLVSLK